MGAAALLLAVILTLLSVRLQESARDVLRRKAGNVFAAPAVLTAIFCAAAAWYGALSWALAGIVAAYTFAPTVVVFAERKRGPEATWFDLLAIALLWFPLELGAGATVVPRPVQGTLHAVAYGIAVCLALLLFRVYRGLEGMKYNVPRRAADFRNALAGFAVCAAVLIPLGLAVGFLNPPHGPRYGAGTLAVRIALILVGTALPEEILFRCLIQNWLFQRVRSSVAALIAGGMVFGLAHLNNAPGPLPNWRYAIVAALAGLVFGRVFQKSTSVFASALVHTGVNTVKYVWF